MKLTAKSVINNQFWIVEENGAKIGTLKLTNSVYQYFDNRTKGTTVYTKDTVKEAFDLVDTKRASSETVNVFGYPTNCEEVFNVESQNTLAVFTKKETSKLQFVAGYFALLYPNNGWTRAYCPKLKTLDEYEWIGPFKSESDMLLAIKRKKAAQT